MVKEAFGFFTSYTKPYPNEFDVKRAFDIPESARVIMLDITRWKESSNQFFAKIRVII